MSTKETDSGLDFDPEAADPPTPAEFARFIVVAKADHERSAKARGYEGLSLIKFGAYDPAGNCGVMRNAPPHTDAAGKLHLSGLGKGDVMATRSDRGPWTVQRVLLMEVWQNAIFVNIVTLIRPLPGTEPPTLITPEFPCETLDLCEAKFASGRLSRGEEVILRILIGVCAGWGDWSAIPQSEFFHFLEPELHTPAFLRLHHLEALGLMRLDKQSNGDYLIQLLPAIVDLFQLETAEPSNNRG